MLELSTVCDERNLIGKILKPQTIHTEVEKKNILVSDESKAYDRLHKDRCVQSAQLLLTSTIVVVPFCMNA